MLRTDVQDRLFSCHEPGDLLRSLAARGTRRRLLGSQETQQRAHSRPRRLSEPPDSQAAIAQVGSSAEVQAGPPILRLGVLRGRSRGGIDSTVSEGLSRVGEEAVIGLEDQPTTEYAPCATWHDIRRKFAQVDGRKRRERLVRGRSGGQGGMRRGVTVAGQWAVRNEGSRSQYRCRLLAPWWCAAAVVRRHVDGSKDSSRAARNLPAVVPNAVSASGLGVDNEYGAVRRAFVVPVTRTIRDSR